MDFRAANTDSPGIAADGSGPEKNDHPVAAAEPPAAVSGRPQPLPGTLKELVLSIIAVSIRLKAAQLPDDAHRNRMRT